MNALVAIPGGWELILVVLVILLLFGAKKLPELARGSGRALRIFKAETKGLDRRRRRPGRRRPEDAGAEGDRGAQRRRPDRRRRLPTTRSCASSATARPADIRRCRISGVLGLYAGKPQHPVGPDGRMALADHLRELRARS